MSSRRQMLEFLSLSRLPSAFQEVEYLESTGTQYIDTGYQTTSNVKVISTYQPERIIIEPSGVGKLSDILKAINTVEEDLQVNIVACVVDGKKAKMQIKNFGEFLKDQIQSAKTIIVSKVDMIDEHKLQETVDLIHTISPSANVVTTSLEEIEDQQILDILEANVSLKDMMIEEVKHHFEDWDLNHHR